MRRWKLKLPITAMVCLWLGAALADEKPAAKSEAAKPNRIERAGGKVSKSIESTGNRAAKATASGVDKAGKWTGRQVDRAGKAVSKAADNTASWVKKKTE
jgi:hypothetical protein